MGRTPSALVKFEEVGTLSKTLLNRLAMFELLDASGPLTISELASRSGLDVSVVSRTVAACEPDGWVSRVGGRVVLGPRFAILGHAGSTAELIALAAPLAHAVAGVTGLLTQATSLIGKESVIIALAAGRSPSGLSGLASKAPVYATAAGRAIAAQLPRELLTSLLPPEPYPGAETLLRVFMGTTAAHFFAHREDPAAHPPSRLPRTRQELDAQLQEISQDGFAPDEGALDPSIQCIAAPWPNAALPTSLACLGSAEDIASHRELIRRVLTVATRPGATPDAVVAAASSGPLVVK